MILSGNWIAAHVLKSLTTLGCVAPLLLQMRISISAVILGSLLKKLVILVCDLAVVSPPPTLLVGKVDDTLIFGTRVRKAMGFGFNVKTSPLDFQLSKKKKNSENPKSLFYCLEIHFLSFLLAK